MLEFEKSCDLLTLEGLARNKDPLVLLGIKETVLAFRLSVENGHGGKFFLEFQSEKIPGSPNIRMTILGTVPETAFSLGYLEQRIGKEASKITGFDLAEACLTVVPEDKIELKLERTGEKKDVMVWSFTLLSGMLSNHPVTGWEKIEPLPAE